MLPRFRPAVFALGWIVIAIGIGEAAMALVAIAADDGEYASFISAALLAGGIGGGMVLATKGYAFDFNFRDAVLLTVSAWFVVPVFAAVPFVLDPVDLTPVDAYFEMVSAVTTTGSTVMTGLDGRPPSLLLWRSTISWLGGFGIIGLAIVILPFLKIGGMQLFRLEFSDRSDKALPRVRTVAQTVGRIYLLLTVLCFATYVALGMTPFDALNHALATVCTGGFSTHDASYGYFDSPALEWAAVIFMTAGAIPFLSYYRIVGRGALRDRIEPQVITLLLALGTAIIVVAASLWFSGQYEFGAALTKSAFNVTSVVTTTGFASADYAQWGSFAVFIFFLLMFSGGATGSTAGGIKMFRFQIIGATILQQVRKTVYPHAVRPVMYGRRPVSDTEVVSVGVFVFLYLASFGVAASIFAMTGLDTTTALSSAATAIGNVGAGLGPIVGPAGNFASFTDFQKLVFSFMMILGRLEILSVLVLFAPSFYR